MNYYSILRIITPQALPHNMKAVYLLVRATEGLCLVGGVSICIITTPLRPFIDKEYPAGDLKRTHTL